MGSFQLILPPLFHVHVTATGYALERDGRDGTWLAGTWLAGCVSAMGIPCILHCILHCTTEYPSAIQHTRESRVAMPLSQHGTSFGRHCPGMGCWVWSSCRRTFSFGRNKLAGLRRE
ncbi:hypothetical protein B0T17DRAFT_361967 [Bombardia bombarda]|uniref:Uncharacterized protein n=1 Tax=Bombardia bombarda TaxID=252184 RepID=A0AA40BW98_9PEZI|nr:hypothetical protein B0T17DRAFT_361967 [Bombardia bombarda]